MSEEKQREYKYVTFSDVMRFLDERVAVRQCPSCASENWTLQHGQLKGSPELIYSVSALPLSVPLAMTRNDTAQMLPIGRPILPLICNNCGYVKMHDVAVIKKWVDANPAENTAEEDPAGGDDDAG